MLKKTIKKLFRSIGLQIRYINPATDPIEQTLAVLHKQKIDIIFDIGANEGQFASEVRSHGFLGNIISFEPLSGARKKLVNMASSDDNWHVHEQCAVGEVMGQIEINISQNSVSSSILPMLKLHKDAANASAYIGEELVTLITLDSVLNSYADPQKNIFIKIDTQGYEWQVLNGASESLKLAKGVLCELSLAPLYQGQILWKEIINRLEGLGFVLWSIQQGFTDPRDGRSLQIDAIFLKQ